MSGTLDTSGTNGQSDSGSWAPSTNYLTGTVDTEMLGWPQTPGVTKPYRAPNTTIGYMGAAGSADTTWTDRPISDGEPRPDYVQNMTGTLDSNYVGANGANGPTSTLLPLPGSKPTVATGPRSVTVSWAAVADPDPTAPVEGYVILGSTGGTTFVGRDATTATVTNLDPSRTYQFRVAAWNKNGTGLYGPLSDAVRPYNPDEPDALNPGGIYPAWAQDPIYNPDGTIKPGTGLAGIPGKPTGVTATPGEAGQVDVDWVAPTGKVVSYTVALSSGESQDLPGYTVSAEFTGLTSGQEVTATVTAHGSVGSTTSDPSAPVTVP